MQALNSKTYIDNLQKHYENHFGIPGQRLLWQLGPTEKLHKDFCILAFAPNKRHNFWTYCTVGMSLERNDNNLIELFIFSPRQDITLIELLTVCASYHQNTQPLNLHHTMNFGRPWLENSKCDHASISLPYLDGEKLEIFNHQKHTTRCYWLIPITEKERDFKIDNGYEALEQLFEDKQFDFLNPSRACLLS